MSKQKRKNDITIEKPQQKGCLGQILALNFFIIIYIIIQGIAGVAGFLSYEDLMINPDFLRLQVYGMVVLSVIMFICAIGLTRWRRWAYYGTILSYSIYSTMLISFNVTFCYSMLIGWSVILILALFPNRKYFT